MKRHTSPKELSRKLSGSESREGIGSFHDQAGVRVGGREGEFPCPQKTTSPHEGGAHSTRIGGIGRSRSRGIRRLGAINVEARRRLTAIKSPVRGISSTIRSRTSTVSGRVRMIGDQRSRRRTNWRCRRKFGSVGVRREGPILANV